MANYFDRLKAFLSEPVDQQEYTLEGLFHWLRPEDRHAFVTAVEEAVSRGWLNRVVRVQSPETGTSIEDYASLLDVPEEIHDWHSDRDIEVTPDLIQVVFKRPQEAGSS